MFILVKMFTPTNSQYLSNYTQAKIDGRDQSLFSRFDAPVEQSSANMAAMNSYRNQTELQNRREFNTMLNNMQGLGANMDVTNVQPTTEQFIRPVYDENYQLRQFQPNTYHDEQATPFVERFEEMTDGRDYINSMKKQQVCLYILIIVIVFIFGMIIMGVCFNAKINKLESKLYKQYRDYD